MEMGASITRSQVRAGLWLATSAAATSESVTAIRAARLRFGLS
jgi:hypothetical protein